MVAAPALDASSSRESVLPFDLRISSRLRTRLALGEEAVLKTKRGPVLRGGHGHHGEVGHGGKIHQYEKRE
jgi:hypothetical protein